METSKSRVYKGKLKKLLVAAAKRNEEWTSYVSQDCPKVDSRNQEGKTFTLAKSKTSSIDLHETNGKEIIVQKVSEKRVSDLAINHDFELKRRKTIVSPTKLDAVGTTDSLNNSIDLNKKLDESAERRSFINHEFVDVRSLNQKEKLCEVLELIEPCLRSKQIVLENLKQVLPFLFTELQLNDLLACRSVCNFWQYVIDNYLNEHPSNLPFRSERHSKEIRNFKLGRIQIFDQSPIFKLGNLYTFSNLKVLNTFTNERRGKIIGSKVCLDNILLEDPVCVLQISPLGFLATFDVEIKYLEIRQRVELPAFKLRRLMDRVKLCLCELPNLKQLKIVFVIDAVKFERECLWSELQVIGKQTYESWHVTTFPKLDHLESLEFEVEILEGWSAKADFFRNFCKSIIRPYCKQVKQLGVIANSIGQFVGLNTPNIVELTIPQRYLNENIKLCCTNVERLKILDQRYDLKFKDILFIETVFPKLVSLSFKFDHSGGEFHDFLSTWLTPTVPNVQTLELENCGVVNFSTLCCFPNIQYLKLVNKCTKKLVDVQDDDLVLNIMKLNQNENLYKSQLFWEHFPNISLVTLEVKGEGIDNHISKFYKWTREKYVTYRNK